jgi:hypothetical protein
LGLIRAGGRGKCVHQTRKKYRRLQNIVQRAGLWIVLLTKYCAAEQIKKDEIGRACRRHGRFEKICREFDWKPERERPLVESLSLFGGIIKMLLLKE